MKKTLDKSDKLRLGSEFAHVRASGRKQVGRLMLLAIASPADEKLRCGVVCGRKFSNRAVIRNRARRLLWESFRLLKSGLSPRHLVLIPRRPIMDAKCQEVTAEMEKLARRAGIWEKDAGEATEPSR